MEGAWGRILHPLQLTSSGRPQLLGGEVECQLMDGMDVELEGHPPLEPLRSGFLTLTTHRLLWVESRHQRSGGALPLAAICQIYTPKKTIKTMFASPRIRLQVWCASDGRIATLGAPGADRTAIIALVARGQASIDPFVVRLGQILLGKAWEADTVFSHVGSSHMPSEAAASIHATQNTQASRWNPARAGVSGILRKEQEQWEEADKNLHEAFQDLNALMAKAKDMVVLAEKIRSRLLAGTSGQPNMGDEDEPGSKQEMQDWLLSVGITSPVTKESAGALYHQQLSRQLADFLKIPLQRSGGMLAMVDAYCLFNRARGTELISPEDLLQACTIWEKIDVPFRMRKFDSGVLVIQPKEDTDDQVFSKLINLIKTLEAKVGISASDAARAMGMAPALAKEYLLTAESQGLLCRDDGADGLRFFENFFKNVEVDTDFS